MILKFNIISYTLWAKFQRPEKDYSISEASLITNNLCHISHNLASSQSARSHRNSIGRRMSVPLHPMLSANKILISDLWNLPSPVEHSGVIWANPKRIPNLCSRRLTLRYMRWAGLPHKCHRVKIIGKRVDTLNLRRGLPTGALYIRASLNWSWCLLLVESITLLSNQESVWSNGRREWSARSDLQVAAS